MKDLLEELEKTYPETAFEACKTATAGQEVCYINTCSLPECIYSDMKRYLILPEETIGKQEQL